MVIDAHAVVVVQFNQNPRLGRVMVDEGYPTHFNDYHVESQLGPGGAYGVTFLVRDKDGNQVAYKWMKSSAPSDARYRFENEAWALKQLSHPSIPQYVDSGEFDGRPFVVMSFASGETLRRLLERNKAEVGVISQSKMLLIMEGLLRVLEYVHSKGIVHRDVKDDNVIISPSGTEITLIDFGVCKANAQPAEGHTFWNAGGSRFSPPAKLENPKDEDPSHDVFAVGVLCYLLLTNEFPWSVTEGDYGDLKALMRDVTPKPVRELNKLVDRDFSDLISELLDIEDHRRPSAQEAGARASSIRTILDSRAPSVLSEAGAIKFERVIRDPLHGDVLMTDFEFRVINTAEFQRLRRIKQLGLSYLVYPGADHTRFAHAVGTLHVTDTILKRIEARTGSIFDNDERLIARTFALVHDIAHIPFGHTLEDELNLFARHDKNERRISRILGSVTSEIGQVLQQTEYGRVVMDLLSSEEFASSHTWVNELVASSVGSDVIDYIDRDALFCGLDHRVDSAIFRQYAVDKRTGNPNRLRHVTAKLYGRHGFRIDADFAILSLLRERFALFLKVYTHTTKVSAGAMVGKAVYHSLEAGNLSEEMLEKAGDDELLFRLRDSSGALERSMAQGIFTRRLYRPVYRAKPLTSDQRTPQQYDTRRKALRASGAFTAKRRAELERTFGMSAGVEPNQIIVYVTPTAPGAQKVEHYVEIKKGDGRQFRDEVYTPHQEIFRDHLSLWNVYVFIHPELPTDKRARIAELAKDEFRLENEVTLDRKQLAFF